MSDFLRSLSEIEQQLATIEPAFSSAPAIQSLLYQCSLTLANARYEIRADTISQLLNDASYRQQVLACVTDEALPIFWQYQFVEFADWQAIYVPALTAQLALLLEV